MSESKLAFIPQEYFYTTTDGDGIETPSPMLAWINDGVSYGGEWIARAYSPDHEQSVIDKLAEIGVTGYKLMSQDDGRAFVKQWQTEEV